MKIRNILWVVLVCFLVTLSYLIAETTNSKKEPPPGGNATVRPFLGRWDLTVKAPDWEYGSWLEIRQVGGEVKAQMVGRWGNARPLPKFEIKDGQMEFVSPKEEEGRPDDIVFKGKLVGNTLVGSTTGPDGTPWSWTGKRAPDLKRTGAPQWGESVQLFNGKDTTGWTFDNPSQAKNWKVRDGTLVTTGAGCNIITTGKFEDFKLHIEFNCPRNANSGIYLRGRYEVQVEDDSIQEPPSHHMGGVYGFLAPSPEMPRKPGQWQSFDITLIGRRVTVVQDGQTIIDNQEIPGITGGALDSHEELPGPIYLQGDHGGIAYRNIVITPAK